MESRFEFDAMGFPYVFSEKSGLYFAALPLTKIQLERRLVVAPMGDDPNAWYERLLGGNPRVSWRAFRSDEVERLVATGLEPEEAVKLVKGLGSAGAREGRTPNDREWRDACAEFTQTLPQALIDALDAEPPFAMGHIARTILRRIHEARRPHSLAALMLMRGGVLEWVREASSRYSRRGFGGYGTPRMGFYPNNISPALDLPTHPSSDDALRFYGVRVVFSPGGEP